MKQAYKGKIMTKPKQRSFSAAKYWKQHVINEDFQLTENGSQAPVENHWDEQYLNSYKCAS